RHLRASAECSAASPCLAASRAIGRGRASSRLPVASPPSGFVALAGRGAPFGLRCGSSCSSAAAYRSDSRLARKLQQSSHGSELLAKSCWNGEGERCCEAELAREGERCREAGLERRARSEK